MNNLHTLFLIKKCMDPEKIFGGLGGWGGSDGNLSLLGGGVFLVIFIYDVI